jgi:mono/diheme cytochrome c family protein
MTIHSLPRNRAIIMLAILILAAAASVPFIVSAQDASPEASPVDSNDPVLVRGEEIFNNVCIACHQPDGKGVEGIYLPLAGNPLVTLEDPTYLITTILNGRGGMPRFDTTYSDEDIAAIATFVRQAWDNDAAPVTAEQVAEVRASFAPPAVNTPVGQKPEGTGRSTPEMNASPVASPVATPAA